MPRSRGGGGRAPSASRAPARPAAAPQRPTPLPPQQSRAASTAAHPSATAQQSNQQPNQQQAKGPGLFGQMASTAAGVAVGSSIGHAIGGMFGGGGGSSSQPVEQLQSDASFANQESQYASSSGGYGARSCETDARSFTKCMDEYQGNMQICNWYLEQLKACQQAAKEY